MKRFLPIFFTLFLLSSFAWTANIAPLDNTQGVNPWWRHSGSGTFKAVTVKEDGKDLKYYELSGGEINLAVDPYRFSPLTNTSKITVARSGYSSNSGMVS